VGTVSYSTGIGLGWDWGPSLGLGLSTGSYGNGFGFSALVGWDSGGPAADVGAWAGGNFLGFGRTNGASYASSPFGSLGSPSALADRELRSEIGLAGQLGYYDRARDASAQSRIRVNASLTDYAQFEPRLGNAFLVGPALSGLGFGQGRSALGHEYWHSVDQSIPSLQDTLYSLEARHPELITIWNSTFTGSDDRGLANVAQELRATEYQNRTSRYRGLSNALNTEHYLDQYAAPLQSLGLKDHVLGLEPRLP
jgi:hypothetical protein